MSADPRVLVLGASGQLGTEITGLGLLSLLESTRIELTEAEIAQNAIVALRPDWIVNCAAWTAVDDAQTHAEAAFAVNRDAAETVARAAGAVHARLVHISTDFVFDGRKRSPYVPEDPVAPEGVYGASKAEGEARVLAALPDASVIRTSWLYSHHGGNFVKTMVRLMQSGTPLRVVDDQRGSPTWTRGLAMAISNMILGDIKQGGIYHWADTGETSWFGFAREIATVGRRIGLIEKEVSLTPVTTAEYGNVTPRPAYSVLDPTRLAELTDCPARPWQAQLEAMLVSMG